MKGFALFLLLASAAVCRADIDLSSMVAETVNELSESAQNVAGSVRDFGIAAANYALGPDNTNTEYCSAEGCEESQGFSRPKSSTPSSSHSTAEDETDGDHHLQLVDKQDDSVQRWNVLSTISNTLTTVRDTVQHTVYKRTTEYAEKVRSVVREEFYELLEGMWERSMGALFSEPGELIGMQ